MERKTEEWFDTWFDSPYYHILYKHRDEEEARMLLDNLVNHLHMAPKHKILDLACGKGRHSIYLNQLGLDVEGVDLSEQNITYAQRFGNDRLHFAKHDMREVYKREAFDFVVNIFTSFGYFASDKEHQKAIQAIGKSLKPGGTLIIDFLNVYKIRHQLEPETIIYSENIEFHIRRKIENEVIVKEISFWEKERTYRFEERVKALTRKQFQQFFEHAGMKCREILGDYEMNPFVKEQSDRMIFIVDKI
ncbi:class I SAM-dependent methyltransferase [Rapidithrix thailandica]|uniref:Class I SAM-dependent methyltransferase n=1 Tax=Rapidithrix thailandica TaxID=413964 RepID=A0AAW9RRU1_9BACT